MIKKTNKKTEMGLFLDFFLKELVNFVTKIADASTSKTFLIFFIDLVKKWNAKVLTVTSRKKATNGVCMEYRTEQASFGFSSVCSNASSNH